MLKKKFKQAVEGNDAGILKALSRAEVNLAVWRDPLSAESKVYLADVPLDGFLRAQQPRRYNFSKDDIASRGLTYLPSLGEINTILLKGLPDAPGKDALARDIRRLQKAFLKAVDQCAGGVQVHGFIPSKRHAPWHVDGNYDDGRVVGFHAAITLAGDRGMFWRTQNSLSGREIPANGLLDPVSPRQERIIREVAPLDLAVFKCRDIFPNPLAHATPPRPMSREPRLVLVMSSRLPTREAKAVLKRKQT